VSDSCLCRSEIRRQRLPQAPIQSAPSCDGECCVGSRLQLQGLADGKVVEVLLLHIQGGGGEIIPLVERHVATPRKQLKLSPLQAFSVVLITVTKTDLICTT